jgi:hypothetical protein
MPKPFESFRLGSNIPPVGGDLTSSIGRTRSRRFACRACHNLTYRSAQKRNARLDRLVSKPDAELQAIIENGNDAWKRLASRAQRIKSGLFEKY